MPAKILLAGIGVITVVTVGLLAININQINNANSSNPSSEKSVSTNTSSSKVKLNDPYGIYNEYSDSSIIRPIESNSEIGTGRIVSVEYDRSKGDKLFYDLYYIQEDGNVQTLGGGVFFTEEGNVFSQEITIYDSLAVKSGVGFIELTTVSDDLKNIKLSMTMVKFVE